MDTLKKFLILRGTYFFSPYVSLVIGIPFLFLYALPYWGRILVVIGVALAIEGILCCLWRSTSRGVRIATQKCPSCRGENRIPVARTAISPSIAQCDERRIKGDRKAARRKARRFPWFNISRSVPIGTGVKEKQNQ